MIGGMTRALLAVGALLAVAFLILGVVVFSTRTEDRISADNVLAENLTRAIWDHLQNSVPAPARLFRVVVRETERNYFEYYGENGTPAL